MSEPSLRDTAIEQALSVYVVEDLLGRHVPAGDAVRDFVTEGVDATLSVLHSQRDAIIEALARYWPAEGDEEWRAMAADAVLRVLGDDP